MCSPWWALLCVHHFRTMLSRLSETLHMQTFNEFYFLVLNSNKILQIKKKPLTYQEEYTGWVIPNHGINTLLVWAQSISRNIKWEHVCECAHMPTCVGDIPIHIHAEARGTLSSLLCLLTPYSLEVGSLSKLQLTGWLHSLARELPRYPSLRLPSPPPMLDSQARRTLIDFYVGARDSNSQTIPSCLPSPKMPILTHKGQCTE